MCQQMFNSSIFWQITPQNIVQNLIGRISLCAAGKLKQTLMQQHEMNIAVNAACSTDMQRYCNI